MPSEANANLRTRIDEVERRLGAVGLEAVLSDGSAIGASRLIALPAHQLPMIHTLIYQTDADVMASTSKLIAAEKSNIESGERYIFREKAVRVSAMRFIDNQDVVSSWAMLCRAAREAASHSSIIVNGQGIQGIVDGACYIHQLCDRSTQLIAQWDNPRRPFHEAQSRIVEAYLKVFRLLNLFPAEAVVNTEKRRKQRRKRRC